MDRRWRIPAVISGLTNIGLVVLLGVLGHMETPAPTPEEVVEVRLVHEDKSSDGKPNVGPPITTPHTEKIELPPPIATPADAEAILEEVKAQVTTQKNVPITTNTGPVAPSDSGDTSNEGQSSDDSKGVEGNDDGVIVDRGSLTLVNDVQAPYPPKMLRQGKTGTVTVQLLVEKDGSVSSVEVIGGSGHPEFDYAVTNVAYQWTFVPATQNGRPVRAYARRTYRFAL